MAVRWPGVSSPWECRCGAVWALVADEDGESSSSGSANPWESLLPASGRSSRAAGTLGSPFDARAFRTFLAESSVGELEDMARAAGEELGRRLAESIGAASPRPIPQEVTVDVQSPTLAGEAAPRTTSQSAPSVEPRLRPACVQVTEDLARAVGEELGRRQAEAARATPPRPPRQEMAVAGPQPLSARGADPATPPQVTPSAKAGSKPLRVQVAWRGEVWHSDPTCTHLYHRGQRRKGIWTGALTEVAAGLQPCRDCSAAWIGTASGLRAWTEVEAPPQASRPSPAV